MIRYTDEIRHIYTKAWYLAVGLGEDDAQYMSTFDDGVAHDPRATALTAVIDHLNRTYHSTPRTDTAPAEAGH